MLFDFGDRKERKALQARARYQAASNSRYYAFEDDGSALSGFLSETACGLHCSSGLSEDDDLRYGSVVSFDFQGLGCDPIELSGLVINTTSIDNVGVCSTREAGRIGRKVDADSSQTGSFQACMDSGKGSTILYTILGDDGFTYKRVPKSAITDLYSNMDPDGIVFRYSSDSRSLRLFEDEFLSTFKFDKRSFIKNRFGVSSKVVFDFLGNDGRIIQNVIGTVFNGKPDYSDLRNPLPLTIDVIDDSERRYFFDVPIRFCKFLDIAGEE